MSLVLGQSYLTGRLSPSDGFLRAPIAMFFWIRFEVNGIRQAVAPIEAVLFHYRDDAFALGREPLVAPRTSSDSSKVNGEAGFVD
jgi:hypothetical protein